ncbi:hypothetical protein [Cryobacterium psychrophilum]|uniref:hypothetical protein n=1 Tax=Cryobacterium psychrophilum TaxID=41988 RepID=UPI0010D79019|nr:hypothetical protein [Cryobacterium psychrophilum]TDW29357.1 hypothetical protein EDD25_1051 [Cryobacterium psychrophilum]
MACGFGTTEGAPVGTGTFVGCGDGEPQAASTNTESPDAVPIKNWRRFITVRTSRL